MKKKLLFSFLIVLLSNCGTICLAQETIAIGILDIANRNGISEEESEYITGIVYNYAELYKNGYLQLIDRERLNTVLHTWQGYYGCAEVDCACKIGELVEADYIIIGNIEVAPRTPESWVLQQILRLEKINVHDGTSEQSLTVTTKRYYTHSKLRNMHFLENKLKYQIKPFFISKEESENYFLTQKKEATAFRNLGIIITSTGLITAVVLGGLLMEGTIYLLGGDLAQHNSSGEYIPILAGYTVFAVIIGPIFWSSGARKIRNIKKSEIALQIRGPDFARGNKLGEISFVYSY